MTERIEKLFSERGLKCTRQRRELYQTICAMDSHPTADELYRAVGGEGSGMSLATVYNTLEAFCHAGLVHKLPGAGANGSARYDCASCEHLHLRDKRTGAVVDAPQDLSQRVIDSLPADVLEELSERVGFHIRQVQIELVGDYEQAEAKRPA